MPVDRDPVVKYRVRVGEEYPNEELRRNDYEVSD